MINRLGSTVWRYSCQSASLLADRSSDCLKASIPPQRTFILHALRTPSINCLFTMFKTTGSIYYRAHQIMNRGYVNKLGVFFVDLCLNRVFKLHSFKPYTVMILSIGTLMYKNCAVFVVGSSEKKAFTLKGLPCHQTCLK